MYINSALIKSLHYVGIFSSPASAHLLTTECGDATDNSRYGIQSISAILLSFRTQSLTQAFFYQFFSVERYYIFSRASELLIRKSCGKLGNGNTFIDHGSHVYLFAVDERKRSLLSVGVDE